MEDFTAYTETDPGGDIGINSAVLVTVTNMPRNVNTHLSKDKGAAFFAGNFTHTMKTQRNTSNNAAIGHFWALANEQNDWGTIYAAGHSALGCRWAADATNGFIRLLEQSGGAAIGDNSTYLDEDTDFWVTIVRDESVGAEGTLYCYIYSDQLRATLVDTLTVTLTAKVDFQYVFAVMSNDSGSVINVTFKISYLSVGPIPPLASHLMRVQRGA